MLIVLLLSISHAAPPGNLKIVFSYRDKLYTVNRSNFNDDNPPIQISYQESFRYGLEKCKIEVVDVNRAILIICKDKDRETTVVLPKCVEDNQTLYTSIMRVREVNHALKITCKREGISL